MCVCVCIFFIHPEETRTEKDTRTLVFIAALFATARTWKQVRCVCVCVCVCVCGILLGHEKERPYDMCRDMDGPVRQSKVSQKEKNKYHILTHIWNLEKRY